MSSLLAMAIAAALPFAASAAQPNLTVRPVAVTPAQKQSDPVNRFIVNYRDGSLARRSPAAAQRIAILAFGTLLYPALQAAQALDATVANMRWVKPLDTALLRQVAEGHALLVTVEEGCIAGGAGSAVLEALQTLGITRPVLQLGLRDLFIEHGDAARLLAMQGLDAAGIEASVRAWLLAHGLPDIPRHMQESP